MISPSDDARFLKSVVEFSMQAQADHDWADRPEGEGRGRDSERGKRKTRFLKQGGSSERMGVGCRDMEREIERCCIDGQRESVRKKDREKNGRESEKKETRQGRE